MPPARLDASSEGMPPAVLVAEDNPLNFELLREVLEAGGHRVQWARDGREALELVRPSHRLLLLDLHMPELDGFEVLERVRANPDLRSLAVVVVTADAMPTVAVRVRAAGADQLVTKPVDIGLLLDAVATWGSGR